MNKKGMLKFLILVIIGVLAVLFFAVWAVNYFFGPLVNVSGSATIEAEPDEIIVYLVAEAKNKTADVASQENLRISNELVSNLKDAGFSEEELKLSGYSIYQWYENGIAKGFIVRQSLTLDMESLDGVSDVIDATVSAGALVSSINFALSDEKQGEFKNLAIEAAGKDARKKAESLASSQDKSLGRLISINSQDYSYIPYLLYERAESDSSIKAAADARSSINDISASNINVNANVDVVYRISYFSFF